MTSERRSEPDELSPAARSIHGNSRMAELIRTLAWSATALGQIEDWPESLRWSVNLMLACAFPSLIFWGTELVQLYNDAFVPLLAERHPSGLGQTARECWSEIWSIIGPRLGRVMQGETIYQENELIPILRDGRLRDVRWTYNYSPIFASDGAIVGILVVCQDVTTEQAAVLRLQESEAQASRILQSIGDAVIVTDPETRVTRMNSVAEQLTGWTTEEARANPWPRSSTS